MAHGPYGKSRDNGASPCLVTGVDPPQPSDKSVSGGSEEPGGGCGRGLVAVEEVSCGEIAGEESTNSSEKPGHTAGKVQCVFRYFHTDICMYVPYTLKFSQWV